MQRGLVPGGGTYCNTEDAGNGQSARPSASYTGGEESQSRPRGGIPQRPVTGLRYIVISREGPSRVRIAPVPLCDGGNYTLNRFRLIPYSLSLYTCLTTLRHCRRYPFWALTSSQLLDSGYEAPQVPLG